MKVKNIEKGPRGINAVDGPVLLEPGEERELDVSAAEARVARKTGWFEIDGEAADEDEADSAADKAERDALKKEAAELGLTFARNISTPKLKEMVEAKRADIAAAGAGQP